MPAVPRNLSAVERVAKQMWRIFCPWLGMLGLGCLLFGALIQNSVVTGKQLDFLLYYSLLSFVCVVAAAQLAIVAFRSVARDEEPLAWQMYRVCQAPFMLYGAWLLLSAVIAGSPALWWPVWTAAAVTGAVSLWVYHHRCSATAAVLAVAVALCSVAAWRLAYPLVWIGDISERFAMTPRHLIVFAGLTALALLAHYVPQQPHMKKYGWVFAIMAAIFLLYLSFRIDGFFRLTTLHHWNVFIQSIRWVRAGEWVGYNIPTQYGYLPYLLAALIPTASVWQAFYLFNGTVILVASLLLCHLLVRSHTQFFCWVWAALVSAGAMSLMSESMMGDFRRYPSSGPVRYLCAYVLIYILAHLATSASEGREQRNWLSALVAVWLIGCFWSVESAFFCSALFGPAWLGFCLYRPEPLKQRLRLLVAPAVLLACAVTWVCTYYLLRLGNLPNFHMLVEYALSFKSGFNSWGMDYTKAALLYFCIILFLLGLAGQTTGPQARFILYSLCLGLPAVSILAINRSHPQNFVNVLPLWIMGLCVAERVLGGLAAGLLTRAVLMHLCILPIFCGFIDRPLLREVRSLLNVSPIHGNVEQFVPQLPQKAKELLNKYVRVGAQDQLIDEYLEPTTEAVSIMSGADNRILPYTYPNPLNIVDSVPLMIPLSHEAIQAHWARLAETHCVSGWLLIEYDAGTERYHQLFREAVRNFYADKVVASHENWILRKLTCRMHRLVKPEGAPN